MPLQLHATARTDDEGNLVVDYAIAHLGGPPTFVCHLDYFFGRPHAVVKDLGHGIAALLFGTVSLPPGMTVAMPPRPAARLLASGESLRSALSLPLPLAETGAVAVPGSDQVVPPVPLRRLLVLVETLVDEGGTPPAAAPGGGLDVFGRKTPREHVSTWVELPPGVELLPTPGGTSIIGHALPRSLPTG